MPLSIVSNYLEMTCDLVCMIGVALSCTEGLSRYGDLHVFHKCFALQKEDTKVFDIIFQSEGCNYETLAKRHLFIHSAVHTVTKDFTCEHCAKAFKSKPALTQHVRIMHTTDVQYNCPKCSFSSHAKQYVQRHMVVHSDVKRHK